MTFEPFPALASYEVDLKVTEPGAALVPATAASMSTTSDVPAATTKAGPAARRIAACLASAVLSAEGSGARTCVASSCGRPSRPREAARTAVTATVGRGPAVVPVEVRIAVIKRVAVEGVRTATIEQPAVVPVEAPSVPAPAKSEERANPEADTE